MNSQAFNDVVQKVRDVLLTSPAPAQDLIGAERACEDLLTANRDSAPIVFLLACVYAKQQRFALAEHSLRRAIEMAPDMYEPWNHLGFVYQHEGRLDEAKEAFERALGLDESGSPEVRANLTGVLINNGTSQRAVDECNRVLADHPDHVDAKWNRSLAYLELGEWEKGWIDHRAGLTVDPRSNDCMRKIRRYANNLPYWDGTPGKKLVIYGEQGVGDEIMAASMLPDLYAENPDIMFECHPRLVTLFRRAFGDKFPIYGTRKVQADMLPWVSWATPEAKVPIFSLGERYRNSAGEFPRQPFLVPLEEYREKARDYLDSIGSGVKIGICWQGGSLPTRADKRSIPLPAWLPLLEGVDAEWISLQYDHAEHPGMWEPIIQQFNADKGVNIHHSTLWANDLDLCYGALIHELDYIITVNTSLVHACGAMGVRCLSLTPRTAAWRYGLEGTTMPWYGDHVQLERQKGREWEQVIKEITPRIRKQFSQKVAA